jgi:prevent-host-death family protein
MNRVEAIAPVDTSRREGSTIPLREARNALSKLADAAHAGDCITLTKHGRPWARLTPVAPDDRKQRQPARWAVTGVDLDPYALISPQHRMAVERRILQQTASQPWGTDSDEPTPDLLERRLLLDTHVLQWWCSPGLLSPLVRNLLMDPSTTIWVSAQSLQELSALGRSSRNRRLQTALARVQLDLEDENLALLSVQPQHLQKACRTPLSDLDLHEALLLAQAQVEAMSLLSADPALQTSELTPLW